MEVMSHYSQLDEKKIASLEQGQREGYRIQKTLQVTVIKNSSTKTHMSYTELEGSSAGPSSDHPSENYGPSIPRLLQT